MKKRKYKAILNIGYKNESVIYFDKLTSKRVSELKDNNINYILLFCSSYMECYLVFDRSSNITEYQQALFNNNIKEYCERY